MQLTAEYSDGETEITRVVMCDSEQDEQRQLRKLSQAMRQAMLRPSDAQVAWLAGGRSALPSRP